MESVSLRIAHEIGAPRHNVEKAISLLDNGATVPFIARYRKEATGGLTDTQLRGLEERLTTLRELEQRRETIISTIDEQGKLTPELRQAIEEAQTRTRLEDLYLPFRPRRRTRAQIAREAGLEPLAMLLLSDPEKEPEVEAHAFLNPEKGITTSTEALEGARHILSEHFSENAECAGAVRGYAARHAEIRATVIKGKEDEGDKFSDYFQYREPIHSIPSHRLLALFRGRDEGILRLKLVLPEDDAIEGGRPGICERLMVRYFSLLNRGCLADGFLLEAISVAWKTKLSPRIETDLFMENRERAEDEAIRVFSENLRDLLLAAPAGPRQTMGLDPGLRTGVKVAVVNNTGTIVDTAVVYPHQPVGQWEQAIVVLSQLCKKHAVELISIGNGTGSRETSRLARDVIARCSGLECVQVTVSEAGASVYSASAFAAQELPDLDVSLRGAVSIARRLQDPLSELVKIEPRSIGVGQYQHDVNQRKLSRALDAVVEDCVNAVGVDVNTASEPLLCRVSGCTTTVARNIIARRDAAGTFRKREELLSVPQFGPKTFEQAAGFLRIHNGENPLDASGVHPESYPLVYEIVEKTGNPLTSLIGNTRFLTSLNPSRFVSGEFGEPTIRDILAELEKPGRDPRPEFVTPSWREGINSIEDVRKNMVLEGVVTNVTNFGAFVDIGVHQDGLIHISELADRFVKNPHDEVKTGDVVTVRILFIDATRNRIGLSRRGMQS